MTHFRKNVAIVFATIALLGVTACGTVNVEAPTSIDSMANAGQPEADSKAEEKEESRTTQVTTTCVTSVAPTTTTQSTTSNSTTTHSTTKKSTATQSTTTKSATTKEDLTKKVTSKKTVTKTTTIQVPECYTSLEELKVSFDMDVTKPTGLSKEDFVKLMKNLPYDYNGYFERNAEVFWKECNKQHVNEIFACGIAAWESGWGQVAGWGNNNYFGISGGNYATEADGVKGLVSLLANNYLCENGACYNGKTITGVSYCYCEPYAWPSGVYSCMTMIVDSKNK